MNDMWREAGRKSAQKLKVRDIKTQNPPAADMCILLCVLYAAREGEKIKLKSSKGGFCEGEKATAEFHPPHLLLSQVAFIHGCAE